MDQKERLERIEAGQEAISALAVLERPVGDYREKLIARMLSNYRSGQTHHDTILGNIAELAALDNLVKELEATVRRGNVAAEAEFGKK